MKKYINLILHILVPWAALLILHQVTRYAAAAKQTQMTDGLIIAFKSMFIEGFIIGAAILIIYFTQTQIMKDFKYGDVLSVLFLAAAPAASYFGRIYVIQSAAGFVSNSGLGDRSGIILASALLFISAARAVYHRVRLLKASDREN